jgi:hypothetical protein
MSQQHDLIVFEHFAASPFPLRRNRGAGGGVFFDVRDGARRGRTTRHGQVCWEDETYAQSRVLLAVPANFDAARPATLVVFLHGNRAQLQRDVIARQQVLRQIAAADINALLVAPQFALDAPDSSAGRFAVRGVFRAFVDEALQVLENLCAARDEQSPQRGCLMHTKLIIIAYSGGYSPAAAALKVGGVNGRIRGVVLLDALYDHEALFAAWLHQHQHAAFLVSAYTHSTRPCNVRLRASLAQQKLSYSLGLNTKLTPGSVCLVPLDGAVEHADVVTRAWCEDPITDLLRRAGPVSDALSTPPRSRR